MMHLLIRLFSLFLLVSAGQSVMAQTSVATYSAFWTGLPVGTVTMSINENAGEYRFNMSMRSGGILGGRSFATTFSSAGGLRGSPLRPYSGRFLDVRRGETRSETITFGRGNPQFESSPAYIIPSEFQFDRSRARGALDPSSALYALIRAAGTGTCGSSFTIFDGFSLYTARISDQGSEDVRTSLYNGPTRKCRLSVSAIAGKAAVDGSSNVPDMVVNVAQVRSGAPAVAVKGALFVNGQRAGLRLDSLSVQ